MGNLPPLIREGSDRTRLLGMNWLKTTTYIKQDPIGQRNQPTRNLSQKI